MSETASGLPNTSHPVDWILFEGNLGSPEMRRIFNENNFIQTILRVEAALARSEAELGVIPEEAAEEIARKASLEYLDLEEVRQGVRRTGHFLVPIIESWRRRIGESGEFVHWGATTQDISDTAIMLLVKSAYVIMMRDLIEIKNSLVGLAQKYKDSPMAGRTHVVHALPITFGLKISVWIDELLRHLDRLKDCEKRLFVGNMAGAAGTYAAFGEKGLDIERLTLEKLGLGVPEIAWYAARDRLSEFIGLLAMIASTLSKVANQVITLMRPEILELEEPISPGHVGSSTMPQKRNPFASEISIALARMIRANAETMTECMETLDERSFSTWFVEFIVIPESCLFMSAILNNLKMISRGLIVHPENMERNLRLSGGLINAEAVMMALAKTMGRQRAHHVVYDCAMRSQREEKSFKDCLLENDSVKAHLGSSEIERLLEPSGYLGLSSKIVEQVLKKA